MDLTQAVFDSYGGFQGINFSFSRIGPGTFVPYGDPASAWTPERLAFKGTILTAVNWDRPDVTILQGYDLSGHDLSGTKLGPVDLHGRDLSVANGVVMSLTTDLSFATLSDGTTGVDLSGQVFPDDYAGFRGFVGQAGSARQMTGVNLSGATLKGADLTLAILRRASLHGTVLTNANLQYADLTGAQGGGADDDSTIHPVSLLNAYMPYATLDGADLNLADLTGVRLYNASLVGAQLNGASMSGAILTEARLNNAKLQDATLTGGSLVNANLDNATLTNAKLDSADLQGADFSTVFDVAGAHLDNSLVSTASGAWVYTDSGGVKSTYLYGATQLPPAAKGSSMTCPDTTYGPCTGVKLIANTAVIYPPQPPCNPGAYPYTGCRKASAGVEAAREE
jgi:uncharacterized protein YjbI with pentapeptide repeats